MLPLKLPWPPVLALTMGNTIRNIGTSSTALASLRDLTKSPETRDISQAPANTLKDWMLILEKKPPR
jgi:hypothetical protein